MHTKKVPNKMMTLTVLEKKVNVKITFSQTLYKFAAKISIREVKKLTKI